MGRRTGALLCGTALALAIAGTVTATAVADEPAALVELAECAAPTPLPAVDGSRTDGDTTVSFQVPAVTRLRVSGGSVVAASTNTGCAPRATDTFVVGDRLATAAEAAAAVAGFRSGDWASPGVWHVR